MKCLKKWCLKLEEKLRYIKRKNKKRIEFISVLFIFVRFKQLTLEIPLKK